MHDWIEQPGINLAGYLRTESGVGAAARGYVRGLRAAGVPVALHDLSHLSGNRAADGTLTGFDSEHPYDTNLICADVEPHFAIVSHLGAELFQDRYNIGAWAWELPHFPEKWQDRFAYYDEIWVGSSFIANALAPVSPIPVVRVPPVMGSGSGGTGEAGRRKLGLDPDEFAFLTVFDVHSHLTRKNPLAVIDAFRLAFTPSDRARLVLKCVNAHADPVGFGALAARAEGHAITIYDGYWPAHDVRDLMAACDAYVSLHRSEGIGLPIADAMALGKPVIATGWSGNMDFMTISNSFPVQYALAEIEADVGPYRAGQVWAEPAVTHAAALMRQIFERREEARACGEAARCEIEAGYSPASVAGRIERRLEAIQTRRQLAAFRDRMWARYWNYQQLGSRIRDAVREALPPGSTVIVVSKGDDGLLPVDGCRAWHFPQTEDGIYAGHYPADGAEAIDHLEALRARGAEFLLFPATSVWWLDHYTELTAHLEHRYRRVVQQDDTCLIYSLRETSHAPIDR